MKTFNQKATPAPSTPSRAGGVARATLPAGDSSGLGIYAKRWSPPPAKAETINSETGEIEGLARDFRTARAERFILKAVAGRLLPKGSRTSKCMRWRVPNRDLNLVYSPEHQRANYQGLQVCGSVHVCPCCSSKISERRRVEVASAIAAAKAQGLAVYLLTLTFPHGLGDDLGEITDKALAAYSKLFRGKAGVGLRDKIGLEGTIRAVEVTHGANGWHPHFHVLLFLKPGKLITPQEVHALVAPRWQKVAVSAGLPMPSLSHGCHCDGGEKAAAYVAKGSTWGLESEITKGQVKIAKGAKGATPFALLRDYAEGNRQAGALFSEYARVFEGKRQLVWSKGLKRRFAIADFSDDELANAPEETPVRLLATITDKQWLSIRAGRLESVVLDLAELSADSLREFLAALPGRCLPPGGVSLGDRGAAATASPV